MLKSALITESGCLSPKSPHFLQSCTSFPYKNLDVSYCSFFRCCMTVNLYDLKFRRFSKILYTVACRIPLSWDACLVDFWVSTSSKTPPHLFHNCVRNIWSFSWHQMKHRTASFHKILVPYIDCMDTRKFFAVFHAEICLRSCRRSCFFKPKRTSANSAPPKLLAILKWCDMPSNGRTW